MYEITIIENRTVTKVVKGDWGIIDTKPMSQEEVDNLRSLASRIGGSVLKQVDVMKDVFGYRPDREAPVVETREVLKQQVEDMDLSAVIKAINKL